MLNKKIKGAIFLVLLGVILILIGYKLRLDRFDRFGMAKIGWIDCVKINEIMYESDLDSKFKRSPVEISSIGKKIGTVKFNVSDMVGNPRYKFRNGDATFLRIGTEIYSINSNNNAIAVKIDNQYFLFKSR